MQKVLIIEDKKSMADMLARTFRSEGFSVETASTVSEGISLIPYGIDVVITDLRLPDGDGLQVLKAVREGFPFIPLIVMTAYGSIETAVKAVKEGAYDFITKPFNPDHLLLLVKRALGEKTVERENVFFKKEFSSYLKMPEIIGESRAWKEVMEKAKKVASLKTTVLILGESGTGKELIARAIHHMSPREKYPFVAVNCAAIPRDLIENELFGHEKGAFTGAGETKIGRFELADRGTIFLDEIGDMATPLQSKLLRVLQESEFERIGGTRTIKVDVRIIAASNKNLEKEVTEGRFREDLFYRLNVFPISIPPLRDRPDDIIPLARHFVSKLSTEMNKQEPSFSPDVEIMLLNQKWQGNARELRNIIERAIILCDGPVLMPEYFGISMESVKERIEADVSLHEITESVTRTAEKAKILEVLKQTHGNKTRAAEILRISYKTLLNKIKEYGINNV